MPEPTTAEKILEAGVKSVTTDGGNYFQIPTKWFPESSLKCGIRVPA